MSMDVVLCALSPKRRTMLEGEPKLLGELLAARREGVVPGLLDLGNTWDALDRLLCRRTVGSLLGDAVVARSGQKMRVRAAFGAARLLEAARVAEIAEALATLPEDLIARRYDELFGKEVHGNFGQERGAPGDTKWLREKVEQARNAELETLGQSYLGLRVLYAETAKAGHAMMSIVT